MIPGGVGNSAAQVEVACAAGATGYTGTPQFLLTLLERAREAGHELPIERALVTGAPLPPPLRDRLQDEFGVDVYQSYGTADAGTLGYECEAKYGWHVAPEIVIELLVPGEDRPAGEGEAGQVVVTSPNEVYPLVRFGTGDLSAWNREPCRCGRTSPRLVGFLGRVGEGVKVKGMFVHPRELAGALRLKHGLGRLPAAELAEHLEGLVHEVRGELPPQGMPAPCRASAPAPRASGLYSTSSGPATGPRTWRHPWMRVAPECPQFRDSFFAPLPRR